jgi:hypothetical protein
MAGQAGEVGEFYSRTTQLRAKPFPPFTGRTKVDALKLET